MSWWKILGIGKKEETDSFPDALEIARQAEQDGELVDIVPMDDEGGEAEITRFKCLLASLSCILSQWMMKEGKRMMSEETEQEEQQMYVGDYIIPDEDEEALGDEE
jgi:hypothetical protein